MAGLSNTNCLHGFDMGEGCVACANQKKLVAKIEKRINTIEKNKTVKQNNTYYVKGMREILAMVKG